MADGKIAIYINDGLIDLDELWHGGGDWASYIYRSLKNCILLAKSKMADDRRL